MKIPRRLFINFSLITLFLLLLVILKEYPKFVQAELLYRNISPNPISSSHPTTLLESWNTTQEYIDNNSPEALITEVLSIDHPNDVDLSAIPGIDGKRRAWMAILINPVDSTFTRLTIWDGEIIDHSTYSLDPNLIPIERPIFDSPEAYLSALNNYPIKPNSNFGVGIHYSVGLDESGAQALAVIGGKGKASLLNDVIIEIDPFNGNILKKISRSFASTGGILYSEDLGETWAASNLIEKMTTAIAADPRKPGKGYAATSDGNQISLYNSDDGGKTWLEFSKLPYSAGNWATSLVVAPTNNSSKNTVLVVTTRNGGWISSDQGNNWDQIPNLPQLPIQWSAILYGQRDFQLFFSIIDGTGKENGIYMSSDLRNWDQIQSGGYYRLSESFDKTQVMAIEQNSGKAWRFTETKSDLVSIPFGTMNVAGDFTHITRMIAREHSSIRNLSASGASTTVTVEFASISASPNLTANQIMIAGGFRNGIYRSQDFGNTWKLTLSDPSLLVSGNNEVWSLVFLSPKDVIAVNGGSITWETIP